MSAVSDFPALDSQVQYGPTYELEYGTRETYGGNITWGANDPLNATWWHLVTESEYMYLKVTAWRGLTGDPVGMEADPTLVQTFNKYEGKSSIKTPPCTGDCIPAKICYMRSGSVPIAFENCIPGWGSVQ